MDIVEFRSNAIALRTYIDTLYQEELAQDKLEHEELEHADLKLTQQILTIKQTIKDYLFLAHPQEDEDELGRDPVDPQECSFRRALYLEAFCIQKPSFCTNEATALYLLPFLKKAISYDMQSISLTLTLQGGNSPYDACAHLLRSGDYPHIHYLKTNIVSARPSIVIKSPSDYVKLLGKSADYVDLSAPIFAAGTYLRSKENDIDFDKFTLRLHDKQTFKKFCPLPNIKPQYLEIELREPKDYVNALSQMRLIHHLILWTLNGIGDECLTKLNRTCEKISLKLNLVANPEDDENLFKLSKKLYSLALNGNGIGTLEALSNYKELPALEILDLSYNPLDDVGISHIDNFPNLTTLILNSTKATDAIFPYLKRFKKLTTIEILGTKITPAVRDTFLSELAAEREAAEREAKERAAAANNDPNWDVEELGLSWDD